MPAERFTVSDVLVEEPLAAPDRGTSDLVRRIAAGTTKPGNWVQLVQFGLVGASGYVANLGVFALLTQALGIYHLVGAVGAFCVAVSSNFLLNRHWTFGAGAGSSRSQARRFFVVSIGALLINLVVLQLLVTAGDLSELPAQAIAVAVAMPFNFIGNKVWTFSWETLE